MEEAVKQEYIYRGRLLNVRRDVVRLPDGKETVREVVEHPGAVVIVALDAGRQVLLVRQYRYAVGQKLLEVPAGTLEQGEAPEHAAPRELKEETGYAAGRWDLLTSYFSSPGILTEEMRVFLARELTAGESEPEGDEDLELVRLPLDQALDQVRRGEIKDGKTIIALQLAASWLDRKASG